MDTEMITPPLLDLSDEQLDMVDVITARGSVDEEHAIRTVRNLSKESVDTLEKLKFLIKESCPENATRHDKIKVVSELLHPVTGGDYGLLPRSIAIRLLDYFQEGVRNENSVVVRRRTKGSNNRVGVSKMNKATSTLHFRKRAYITSLLGGPEAELCAELTPASFMAKHHESISQWVEDTLKEFNGIGREELMQGIQECYKNRRKTVPRDVLVRGVKGRKRKETQQEAEPVNTPENENHGQRRRHQP